MTCGNCGAKLSGAERFCPRCGKSIYRAAQPEKAQGGAASAQRAASAAPGGGKTGGSPARSSRTGKRPLRVLVLAAAVVAVLALAFGAAQLLKAPQRFDDPLLLVGQYIQTMQQKRPAAGLKFYLPQALEFYREQGYSRRQTAEVADSALAADIYRQSDGCEVEAELPWDSDFYGSLFAELGAEVLEGRDILLRFTADGAPLDAPQFCAELVRTPQGWFLLSVYKI